MLFTITIFVLTFSTSSFASSSDSSQNNARPHDYPTPSKILPGDFKYYMNRTLISRTGVSPSTIFDGYLNFPDILVFTGIDKTNLSTLANGKILVTNSSVVLAANYITGQFIILDNSSHFSLISKKTNLPVHLLRYNNNEGEQNRAGYFTRIRSTGKMENYFKYIGDFKEESEEEFFEELVMKKDNQPTCIEGSHLASTSIFLTHVRERLSMTYPERKVIWIGARDFINLIKSRAGVNNGIRNETQMAGDIEVVLSNELKIDIDGGDNATITTELILDGVDELVGSIYESPMYEIIGLIISSFKSIRLWITSRNNGLEELKNRGMFFPRNKHEMGNRLSTICYKLKPMREQDVHRHLVSSWSKKGALNVAKLNQFAQDSLKGLDLGSSKVGKLFDTVLLTLMMTEVYKRAVEEYAYDNNSTTNTNNHKHNSVRIANLYREWIHKKFDDYKKAGNGNATLDDRELMNMHIYLSLKFLFPGQLERLNYSFGPVVLEEVFKVGIVERPQVPGGKLLFLDRTIAEYFVAQFVTDILTMNGKEWELGEDEKAKLIEFILEAPLATQKYFVHISDLDDTFHSYGIFSSHKFTHPTIGYFLNQLLEEAVTIPNNSEQRLIDNSDYYQNFNRKLAHSCVESNSPELFRFLNGSQTFDRNASEIFDAYLVYLAIQHSSVEFIRLAFNQFELHHQNLSLEELEDMKSTALVLAIRRADYQIVKFLMDEKGLDKHLAKLDGNTKFLLHDLISKFSDDSARLIDNKIMILKLLVGINPDLLEQKDWMERTPLLSSAPSVRLLLELVSLGADVLVKSRHNETVIHLGENRDRFSAEEYHSLLVSIPADKLEKLVNLKTRVGLTPLTTLLSALDPTPASLDLFKKVGAELNTPEIFFMKGPDKKFQSLCLMGIAISNGRSLTTVRKLIELGADPASSNGTTLLHIAAKHGRVDLIPYLVDDLVIDVNAEDEEGLQPLNYAIKISRNCRKCYETGLALHSRGATYKDIINNSTTPCGCSIPGQSLFHMAAQEGNVLSIALQLQLGVDVNYVDADGNTAIHLACLVKPGSTGICHFPTVAFLLHNNANPNLLNNQGQTAFQIALKNEELNLEAFRLLKDKTVNMTWDPIYASRALAILVKTGNDDGFTERVQELEDYGAGYNFRSEINNNSLLHTAAYMGNQRVVHFLVEEKGADVNSTNKFQRTPLHETALGSGKDAGLKLVKYLIEHGANVHGKDIYGNNFLHYYFTSWEKISGSQFYLITEYLIGRNLSHLFLIRHRESGHTPYQLALRHAQVRPETRSLLHSNGIGSEQEEEDFLYGSG